MSLSSTANLKKIQALSGLIMAIYACMHLFNHYMLNIGYDIADTIMMKLRLIYQHPIFEITFYMALVTHFYANTLIYLRRSKLESSTSTKKDDDNKQKSFIPFELKAHRYAGYILSVLVIAHVIAVRATPLVYFDNAKDFDYSFAAAAIAFFPFHSFTVYYIVLGCTGGWHLIYGIRAAVSTLQNQSVLNTKFPMFLKVMAMISHILIIGAVLALGTYSTSIDWSDTKRQLHDHFFKSMGL